MKTTLLLIFPMFLIGCLSPNTSQKPRYFKLQPAAAFETSDKAFTLPFLIIGPVDLSPYLDQPKFAVRLNENEIEYQEYERWAEPLEVNVSEVLATNLRHYFQTPNIGPGVPKILLKKEQPRVLILINRMDVNAEGKATFSTQWAFNRGESDTPTPVYQGSYTAPVHGDDITARVAALNQLLTQFSLELAKTIEEEM